MPYLSSQLEGIVLQHNQLTNGLDSERRPCRRCGHNRESGAAAKTVVAVAIEKLVSRDRCHSPYS
jgi:hypothetical protein